jgi:hypothetical protein
MLERHVRRIGRQLIGGNDELGVSIAAHAVNGAGGASSNCVSVAAGMLSGDGDGAIRAADDGTLMIEGVFGAEINDEPRVP